MVTIAIGGLLLMYGTPLMADYLANARLRSAGEVVRSQALYAQHEAIRRNGVVRVAITGSAVRVLDLSAGAETLLSEQMLPDGISVDADVDMNFGSVGQPADFGDTYTVGVSMQGVTCTHEHRCPSLNVDIAGGITLCVDKTSCR